MNVEMEYGTMVDKRDYHVYAVVKIGSQVWMAQNLSYEIDSEKGSSHCYNDSLEKCDRYGRLYSWSAAMDENTCPEGWHLPSYAEWMVLKETIDGNYSGGNKLKSTSFDWKREGGTDDFGFSALPAGYYDVEEGFSSFGARACFWTSDLHSNDNARYWYVTSQSGNLMEGSYSKDKREFSVRCVWDESL